MYSIRTFTFEPGRAMETVAPTLSTEDALDRLDELCRHAVRELASMLHFTPEQSLTSLIKMGYLATQALESNRGPDCC